MSPIPANSQSRILMHCFSFVNEEIVYGNQVIVAEASPVGWIVLLVRFHPVHGFHVSIETGGELRHCNAAPYLGRLPRAGRVKKSIRRGEERAAA